MLICWDVGVPKPKNGPWVLEEGPQTPQQQQQHRTNTACVLSLSLHWAVVRVCVPTFEVAHANTVCVCVCLGVWSSVWVCVQGSKNYRLWRYVKAGVRGGGRLDGYTHLFKTHTHKHTHTTYAKCVCVCVRVCWVTTVVTVVVPHCDWASVIIAALLLLTKISIFKTEIWP